MRITATLPDHGLILESVLEGFVLAAMNIIAAGVVPPYPQQAGVTYRPEQGTEEWLLPNQVMQRGYGDCEDLAIWAAAGYRVTGDDPSARCVLVMTGPGRIHCIVGHGDGPMEDVAMTIALAERTGYAVGDVLTIKDHRSGKPPPKSTLPPAAANPNPTQTSAADQAIDKYMADNKIKVLTIDTNTGIDPTRSGVIKKAPTPAQLRMLQQAAADSIAQGGQGNVAAAFEGLSHAAQAGDSPPNMENYGKGTRSTAVRPPIVGPATDQYGQPIYDVYGNQVYADANGNPVDSRGMPIATGNLADNDPYGGGQYPGMYGLYDPYGMYGQDPFYHGEFPNAQPDYPYGGWQNQDVPYGGWQSEGQPMLTYEDIYGEWTGNDEAGAGPIPAEYGPMPGDAYGEESYDGQ
jgi:hypothetical protein